MFDITTGLEAVMLVYIKFQSIGTFLIAASPTQSKLSKVPFSNFIFSNNIYLVMNQ